MRPILHMLIFGVAFGAFTAARAEIPQAARETARALIEQALDGSGAYEIVESLTTEVGPRLAGTEADRRAVEWAQKKLTALGFEKVRTEPVEIPLWLRGAETAEIVAPYPQKLHVTALGHSVATPDDGVTAQVVRFHNVDALRAAGPSDIEGKIVYLDRRQARTQDGSGYGPTVANRAYGPIEAAKKGAVAVVIRSVGTDSHRLPHTGGSRYEEDDPRVPAAALSNPDADQLERILERGEPVRMRLTLTPVHRGMVTTHNVIAEIAGRETPGEIVLLGAHLDSWDLGTGAIDDGAGVGIVTAAAKLIADLEERPRRTIRVVLYGAEEIGLYGAKAYAARHTNDLANHVMAAESDFGAGRIWKISSNVGEGAVETFKEIAAILSPLGIHYGNNLARGGPDIGPLREANVPVATLHQDGTDYFDLHHTADDTLDKIAPENLDQNVAAYAAFAYLAAELGVDFRAPAKEDM